MNARVIDLDQTLEIPNRHATLLPSIPPLAPPPHPPPTQPGSPQPISPIIYLREKVQWEYKRITCNLIADETLAEEELNDLGADGWELSHVVTQVSFVHYYFKRRKETAR